MTRMLTHARARVHARALALVGAIALAAVALDASAALARGATLAAPITITAVAAQLGVTVQGADSGELAVGASFTGMLADPAKLARFGITGVHKGARVTVMRAAPDRLRVDVDELDPVPASAHATLRIGDTGELAIVAQR